MGSGSKNVEMFSGFSNQNSCRVEVWVPFFGFGYPSLHTHVSTEIICKIRNFLLHCFISPQRQRECERPNHLMHFG